MGFAALNTDAGLATLNAFLEDKSYIDGFVATQADVAVFAEASAPAADKYPHAARWYSHIQARKAEHASFPGEKKAASAYGPAAAAAPAPAAAAEEDDDDVDLFASDDEFDEEAEKIKQQRLAEYHAKKAVKPKVIAKSMITFDVKPWDDETNMKELEQNVRSIVMDGLLWGASQLVAVGYGIKKLRIAAVVEDDKVSTDDLAEKIQEYEDYVQSVDVEAFQKI
ncbi:eukaryotic translation elongation factor-like protein 1 beta 2 [Ramicandelaber brevisporus]|nr:eukaryotic translation elongation factor-like protein 1 beta 2 [Ramicandelaber brevisporus]